MEVPSRLGPKGFNMTLPAASLAIGRMSQVDRLTSEDIDFQARSVVLYTGKKKRRSSHSQKDTHDHSVVSSAFPAI